MEELDANVLNSGITKIRIKCVTSMTQGKRLRETKLSSEWESHEDRGGEH